MSWQPIETAPRDGTEFIAYSQDVRGNSGLNPFVSLCAWHDDAGFCTCELRDPTHWMPLPAAPDATSPASQVGMEAPLGRNETRYFDLIERLRSYESRDDGARLAADAIRDLEAENACLRSAPIPAVQSGAVAWRDMADAPHGVPILVQFHEWNDKGRPLAEQVAWFHDDAWRKFPDVDGEAYADRWKPIRTYASPQSEPLPGGVGEAVNLLRRIVEIENDNGMGVIGWGEVIGDAEAFLAALSGKEQG